MDVPGLSVLDAAEIKGRKELHGLLYLRADIVGRFHYLPERWFNYDAGLRFMPLENDTASPKSPPHGRHQYHIHIDLSHLLPGPLALLNSLLSYLNIQILVAEFLLGVLLGIGTPLHPVLVLQILCHLVEFGLRVPYEIYHL